jgi:chromosomal replication initiation ATPase DnaA
MNCEPCINEFLPETKRLTKDEILEAICLKFGIEIRQIKGKRRDYNIVEARHLLCYILNSDNYLRLYLREIGELINRHHSTVIHSIEYVERTFEVDAAYRRKVADLYVYLYGTTEYLSTFVSDFVEKQNKIKSIANQFNS